MYFSIPCLSCSVFWLVEVSPEGQAESYVALILQAIKKFARLRRPVYITETGIADKSDALRAEWAESYFKAVGLPAFYFLGPR